MKIWYNDNNRFKGTNFFVSELESLPNVDLREFQRIGLFDRSGGPDYFVVNPLNIPMNNYWNCLKECADFYPDSKFKVICSSHHNKYRFENVGLGSLENVDLVNPADVVSELNDIVTEAKEFSALECNN